MSDRMLNFLGDNYSKPLGKECKCKMQVFGMCDTCQTLSFNDVLAPCLCYYILICDGDLEKLKK